MAVLLTSRVTGLGWGLLPWPYNGLKLWNATTLLHCWFFPVGLVWGVNYRSRLDHRSRTMARQRVGVEEGSLARTRHCCVLTHNWQENSVNLSMPAMSFPMLSLTDGLCCHWWNLRNYINRIPSVAIG
ncbi:hypothetical protein K439DRAFT_1663835 [Ramaria rubella]|nr:hypothetical protein K439DRAFT_1663835 [Ramaria rubella]